MEKLEWDTNFWNISFYNLEEKEISNNFKFNVEDDNFIVQAKIKTSSISRINIIENLGFQFYELELKYVKNKLEFFREELDEAGLDQINEIQLIAMNSIEYSRYNFISKKKAKEFYALWAGNAVRKVFDDGCLIARNGNVIRGFITYKMIGNSNARIGLICVDKEYQGMGVGGKLIRGLEGFLKKRNINKLYVSTQGRNIVANNFYIKNGYRIEEINKIYYYRK